jgi:hypothetical protein
MKKLIGLILWGVIGCSSPAPAPDPYWLDCLKQSGLMEVYGNAVQIEINAYRYKGAVVFGVDSTCTSCADMMGYVYSCTGEKICEFGGIAGLNTCPDFVDLATDKELVWKN